MSEDVQAADAVENGDATVPFSYDTVPYLSYAYPQTHPDRLHVIGRLFGMSPVPAEEARVLEIGCASGGNLIPMAETLPGASFLGIDLSERQVKDGQAVIDRLGLKNIALKAMDIAELAADAGPFDYIICHGVYSWIPDAVQKRIVEICKSHLSPQGIAYISYNIYPGWHMRGMLRDMMVYHAGRFAGNPGLQVREAKGLVEFLSNAVKGQETAYSKLLQDELKLLGRVNDSYIFHEHLEDHNRPIYFHEFEAAIRAQGLQYLGEANFHMMLARNLPKEVAQTLQRVAGNDIVRMEQYMDFVRNGTFRQTLICHGDLQLNRNIQGDKVRDLYVACAAVPQGEVDPRGGEKQDFKLATGQQFTTANPMLKLAIPILRKAWPEAVKLSDLAVAINAGGGDASAPVVVDSAVRDRLSAQLANDCLFLFASGMAELRPRQLGLSSAPGARPSVTELTRYSAASGRPLINLRHETVNLNDLARNVIALLDGSRDEQAILDGLVDLVAADKMSVQQSGTAVKDPERVRELLRQPVSSALQGLAERGFLQAGAG
mgnify:CR=1 FL=1